MAFARNTRHPEAQFEMTNCGRAQGLALFDWPPGPWNYSFSQGRKVRR